MRCEHYVGGIMIHTAIGIYSRWTRECLDCGAWLSLGPSNDEPEAVKVEMRAAEIFALPYRGTNNCSISELIGWDTHRDNFDHAAPKNDGQLSGYLARAIAEHEEGKS